MGPINEPHVDVAAPVKVRNGNSVDKFGCALCPLRSSATDAIVVKPKGAKIGTVQVCIVQRRSTVLE